ncbi:RHS repeat domain-containing protein [Bovifimicola ammoniilytica]|uniref:RHS repeat domain-containing protein n=1 Tax=Bovifimicola ammoniilytica TaxID=2981720 RepID=UPI000820D662|nr:RHS repeat-associated core domain-containing protein [Bovifimicola ammoniilytica]MCU6752019.1 RHS repeat-associated core domain-containing protein [Bovifimicola ammoniilytica]SCJ05382.1 Cell wall-associated polypeptide CWBP200 [uncultured Eubacterium sp.]
MPVPDTANKTALKLAAESNSIVTSDGETVTTSLEMEYDSANRLISYNNKKIKYDKDGNMLYGPVNGEMCNLTYDSRNRLISAGNVTYDYDAENTRISVKTTDKKITYVTDVAGEMSQVLESYEKTNGGKKIHTVYVYGNGLIYSYNDDEADSITSDNKVQDLSSDKSSDKDADGTTYYHYNNIGSTTKLTDNNGNVIQSYEYGAYGEVLSGDTKITPFLYNGQLGVMTDENGLYYMRARYYNVNIKRFINQDVVHGSINVSQSLNRYSYVQGNPIKLTDPFGLSPLDKINWRNVGHSALNILGCINGYGFIFDGINAVWYACEGDYGMAALSLISTLSDTGNMIAFGLKSTKFARVGQYIGAITQLVSNAATFTQAAISGLENAKAIFRNAKSGKLLSIDTASNVAALGLNLFTTIVSGKGAVTSGKNIKKMIGTDVGNKWGNKANNKPLLECNLQFFGDKNGGKGSINSANGLIGHDFEEYLTKKIGGNGSFSAGGRDFDGGISNRWWEAKSGQYWDMLENNPNKLAKFKSDMGDRLRIATQNNASYEIFSNTPIPNSIKMWLTKKGIHYTEILD